MQLKIKKDGLFRFTSRYGVMLLMLAVALHQLNLRKDGLSSWKGGGMGMYAEMHPVYTKILLNADPSQRRKGSSQLDMGTIQLLSNAQFYPTNVNLKQIKNNYQYIYGFDSLTIQVWTPVFNPKTGFFQLSLKKEY